MLTTATQQRNSQGNLQGNLQSETPPISIETSPIAPIIDAARIFSLRFIARIKRIGAILIMSVLVTLISACGGGGGGGDVVPPGEDKKTGDPISVSNLRVFPDVSSAMLMWDNPDADIQHIDIIYTTGAAASFESRRRVTDPSKTVSGKKNVTQIISGLTSANYTFNIHLELGGVDESKSVMARERTLLIGPNLDGDEYADAEDVDDDNDGVNDLQDAFPRNDTLSAFAVSGLRVIPDVRNATLIWDNPDADIANISISYKLSTADNFSLPITITDNARLARNIEVREMIPSLTSNTNYTFSVTLELKGADENKSVMARERTLLIGPNLDGDEYADADPNEFDIDGDDVNNTMDAFPSDPNESVDTDGDRVGDNADAFPEDPTEDTDTDGDRVGNNTDAFPEDPTESMDTDRDGVGDNTDAFPTDGTLYAFVVSNLRVIPDVRNATLIWDNPDADIANISISYKLSTADNFAIPITIIDDARLDRNIEVREMIPSLTSNTNYTFSVTLELKGADENKSVIAAEIMRLIGSNLDRDEYADADPNEFDIDGDDVNNTMDAFPSDPTESVDTDGDRVGDNADNCPLAMNNGQDDFDNDVVGDACDIDYNGNGLIDIATAQQLNQSRHNLLGSNFTRSAGGVGDANGCGNGGDITECNGYELIADIYLTTYANWQPIGGCPTYASSRCTDTAALFNAIFDGNNHTINNLTITNPAGSYANASGLFGAISSDSILRNIHIRSGNISDGGNNVGLLVGYARGENYNIRPSIINSSAEGAVNASGDNVGGLVGFGALSTIMSSYAAGGAVSGRSNVGGLVGLGIVATIMSSYAAGGAVSGDDSVGGLVGDGRVARITSSYAAGGAVSGTDGNVGGLVGRGFDSPITSSYAAGGDVSGRSNVGGLVGSEFGSTITSSYAAGGAVSGDSNVGGLVGSGDGAITSSYAAGGSVSGRSNVGGLVGSEFGSTITSSYAAGGAVSGDSNVGGLVGSGDGAITSSYAAGGSVSGLSAVGGLVGYGRNFFITSSYAAGGSVSGNFSVGGLVGSGDGAITSSYAAGGDVSGRDFVGGLVGNGLDVTITSSYAAGGDVSGTGSNVGGLVGSTNFGSMHAITITASYWDSEKSGQESSFGGGDAKTTEALKAPTDGDLGIYSTWASGTCADGTTLVWEFGTSSDYPALRCTPNGLPAQEHLRQR